MVGLYKECFEMEPQSFKEWVLKKLFPHAFRKRREIECSKYVVEAFLDGVATENDLREAGFDDVAIDYLKLVRSIRRKWVPR